MSDNEKPEPLTAPKFIEGAWKYPDGWTDEQRRTWEGIQGRKIAETKALEDIQARAAAAASSPEALIAQQRREADEAQRERECAERRAQGEAAWAKAREERADIERTDTIEGDVVIQRAMTRQEADASVVRANNLAENAKTKAQAFADVMGAHRDALLSTVLHPSRERVRALCERYPSLYAHMEHKRDKLIDGRRLDEGKGSAP